MEKDEAKDNPKQGSGLNTGEGWNVHNKPIKSKVTNKKRIFFAVHQKDMHPSPPRY